MPHGWDAEPRMSAMGRTRRLPLGMIPTCPHLYAGGAVRHFASGRLFTGEARWKPLGGSLSSKRRYISSLHNHDLGMLDSFIKSTKSSLPNALGEIDLAKSSPSDTFNIGGSARDGRGFAPRQVVALPSMGHGPKSTALSGSRVQGRPPAYSVPYCHVILGRAAAAAAEQGKQRR